MIVKESQISHIHLYNMMPDLTNPGIRKRVLTPGSIIYREEPYTKYTPEMVEKFLIPLHNHRIGIKHRRELDSPLYFEGVFAYRRLIFPNYIGILLFNIDPREEFPKNNYSIINPHAHSVCPYTDHSFKFAKRLDYNFPYEREWVYIGEG